MTESPDVDRELAARILARGDDAAAAERELCRRWGPRIAGFGARHLRDAHVVDDLLQRVLLTVVVALRAGRIEAPERIGSYILTTCRRTTWELNRRTAREAQTVSDEGLPDFGETYDWRGLDRVALDRCLSRLPEREREVVVATYWDELGSDRIAERLAITPGHVRVIRHRALGWLLGCMEGPR